MAELLQSVLRYTQQFLNPRWYFDTASALNPITEDYMLVATQILVKDPRPEFVIQTVSCTKPTCILVPQENLAAIRYITDSLSPDGQFPLIVLGWPNCDDQMIKVEYVCAIGETSYHLVEIDPGAVSAYDIFQWLTTYYQFLEIDEFHMIEGGVEFRSSKTDLHIYLSRWGIVENQEYFTESIMDGKTVSQTLYKYQPRSKLETFADTLRSISRVASLHCNILNTDDTIPCLPPNIFTIPQRIQMGLSA